MKSIAKRTNPLCFAHNVVNSQIASLFGRCNILGHPVVIAGINIGIGNIFAADQIRFRIPQYDSAGIIHHDFLHLYDDISPFCRIKFTGQFFAESVIFRIAVPGSVFRRISVFIGTEVYVCLLYTSDAADD